MAPYSTPKAHSQEEVEALMLAAAQLEELNKSLGAVAGSAGGSGVMRSQVVLLVVVVMVGVVVALTAASYRVFDR